MTDMNLIKKVLILIALNHSFNSIASDTLRITIHQADSIFLNKNILLLIEGLKTDEKKAAIIQAKLYPNPVFTMAVNAYDPENNRAFHVQKTGQTFFQFEQLILLGGKRKSWIEMANKEAKIAELEFQHLLQNLKFKVRTGFYSLDRLKHLIEKYDEQIKLLKTIIDAYEMQSFKGNISLKDVVRLKGASLNLRSEKADLIQDYTELMIEMQLLLQTDLIIEPMMENQSFVDKVKLFDEHVLIDMAIENRSDIQILKQMVDLSELNIQMEKRRAVPDLNFFANYDKNSGAFQNETNVGISIPLPLWDRNQGNVQIAKRRKDQMNLSAKQSEKQLIAEVKGAFWMYNRAVRDFEVSNELFSGDFELTASGMSKEFQSGNISLIEFIDFFESFNDALDDYSRIKIQLATAAERLNLTVGKEMF